MKSLLLSSAIRIAALLGLGLIPGVIPSGKAMECTDAFYDGGNQYCIQCYVEGPGRTWIPIGDTQWWQRI